MKDWDEASGWGLKAEGTLRAVASGNKAGRDIILANVWRVQAQLSGRTGSCLEAVPYDSRFQWGEGRMSALQ